MYGVLRIRRYAVALVLAAAVLLGGACLAVFARDGGVVLPVVMYHAVIDDAARQGPYVIDPETLESDFRWLRDNGYTAVLSQDLLRYVHEGVPLPEKPVLLTFDDGYLNNYRYAYPLAKQYGMRFVLSPIGKYAELYTENPDDSVYYAHATWPQLREMQDSGVVEIGNHTYDLHETTSPMGSRRGAAESEASYRQRLRQDVLGCQRVMEQQLGQAPVLFAYPFGAVSDGEPQLIREMGFSVTLSCEEKRNTITRDAASLELLGRYLRPAGETSAAFFQRILA